MHRVVIEARVLNTTNRSSVSGILGMNHFPTDGFGLNHPVILVCLTRDLRKRHRKKEFLNGFWTNGSCSVNNQRQTQSPPRPTILLLSPHGSKRLGILALENLTLGHGHLVKTRQTTRPLRVWILLNITGTSLHWVSMTRRRLPGFIPLLSHQRILITLFRIVVCPRPV